MSERGPREKAARIGAWAYSQGPHDLNAPKLPTKGPENKIPVLDSMPMDKNLPSSEKWPPRDAKQRLR